MSELGTHGGRVVLDLPYGRDPAQVLDLYTPADLTPGPLVVVVHGGGWSVGDKAQYAAVGARLASEGIVAAIVNYRLSPDVQHPAHVQDVARAVRWCARHGAEYGADRRPLALMGHSSGAHLAALVALDPQYLAAEGLEPQAIGCVLGVAGVGYDLDARYATPQLHPFFAPVFGVDPSRWEAAAPIRYVSAAAPPFGLIHGLADSEAPPASTERFAAALQRAEIPTDLTLLEGEGHISVMFAAAPLAIDFVRRGGPVSALTSPRPAAPSAPVV